MTKFAPTHRDNAMPEVEKFLGKNITRPGFQVLELGAGNDTQFRELFEQKYGMRYTGIDQLPITNGPNCYQGRMESLPFVSNKFDLVFACHAFEHTEKPVDSLKEAMRVLNKGGFLFLLTPVFSKHHILEADSDHINVLHEWQMKRLLTYTEWAQADVYMNTQAPREQDHFMVTIARKK